MTNKVQFVEPTGEEQPAGFHKFKRLKTPYEHYMEEEGIPVFRGVGCRDTRNLPLGDWKRLGARGTFLYLSGIGPKKGMYLLEVPAGGAVLPEKHIYDEFFVVIEGRGSTEVWTDSNPKKNVFEWQAGTLFMVPINAWHRFVNASSSPALLLCANNAPSAMNLYLSRHFVFNCSYDFSERYGGGDDFFKAKDELEAEQYRGRAAIRSNVFPDIVNCHLPLDNQRLPGYRRIAPHFSGFPAVGGFVSQYPSGRYSKGHYHASGAVLVCLKGKGYSYNWRVELGPRPWQDEKGDQVNITEYIPGGLVSAAPGGGNWFHQHFSAGAEPLRVINFWGGPTVEVGQGEEPEELVSGNIYSIYEGGRTILYPDEDPYVRNHYKEVLHKEGVEFTMPDHVFDPNYRPSKEEALVSQI